MLNTLIVALVWPEPDASAAGSHMMDLISVLERVSSKITFACTAATSHPAENLEARGIDICKITVNDSGFDELLQNLNPDIVVFDRFMAEEQFSWRVKERCPDTLRILNTEDLHGLRKSRELAVKTSQPESGNIHLMNDVMKREVSAMYRSDLNLVISNAEIQLLKEQFRFQDNQVHYFPLLSDPCDKQHKNTLPAYEKRSGFMTIGSFKHPPNRDSVQWLKQEIWGKIRTLKPDAELRVYGSYMNDKWKVLHDESEGFLMMGAADNVQDVMKDSRLLLAPLRFGAGLKGKLLDAMFWGTPFITTAVGMEGYEKDFGSLKNVADNPDDFAELAVKIHNDEKSWNSLQVEGFGRINSGFNRAFHLDSLADRIDNAFSTIKQFRKANPLGEVFWHNSQLSTKYMSRWIELKNRSMGSGPEKTTDHPQNEIADSNSKDVIRKGQGND